MAVAGSPYHVSSYAPLDADFVNRHIFPAKTGAISSAKAVFQKLQICVHSGFAVGQLKMIGDGIADRIDVTEPGMLSVEAYRNSISWAKCKPNLGVSRNIKVTIVRQTNLRTCPVQSCRFRLCTKRRLLVDAPRFA